MIQRGGLTARLIERGGIEQFIGDHSMRRAKVDGDIETISAIAGTMASQGAVDYTGTETIPAVAGTMETDT